MEGEIIFSDQKTETGYNIYSLLQKTLLQRILGDGYIRTIQWVDIAEQDTIPDDLLRDLAGLPDLRLLDVSPVVADKCDLGRLKSQNPLLEIHVRYSVRHSNAKLIKNSVELQKVPAADRAVLFIDGEWSIACARFRRTYSEAIADRRKSNIAIPVEFFVVDGTDYVGAFGQQLGKWQGSLGLPGGGMRQLGGVGRVVWLKKGVVARSEWIFEESTKEEFLRRTVEVFDAQTLPE